MANDNNTEARCSEGNPLAAQEAAIRVPRRAIQRVNLFFIVAFLERINVPLEIPLASNRQGRQLEYGHALVLEKLDAVDVQTCVGQLGFSRRLLAASLAFGGLAIKPMLQRACFGEAKLTTYVRNSPFCDLTLTDLWPLAAVDGRPK